MQSSSSVSSIPNADTADKAWSLMFVKSCAPEALPPTSDALLFHIKRAHYQAAVWKQAHKHMDLPLPEEMGWKKENNSLLPIS